MLLKSSSRQTNIRQGFSIDGRISDNDEWSSYVLKCVYVQGPSASGDSLLEGFVLNDLYIRNCG